MADRMHEIVANSLEQSALADHALVRSTNDLYKSYGTGRVQKLRNGHAKVEFNPSGRVAYPLRQQRVGPR